MFEFGCGARLSSVAVVAAAAAGEHRISDVSHPAHLQCNSGCKRQNIVFLIVKRIDWQLWECPYVPTYNM